eukprot:CAMPEP_0181328004 /NCGR_PEP_ID=MMETSP1101-20121128/22444_1 /TAXON_ID=46948 /ORGANISM="Rhodomonas abbreviata, Strain Caron Lab Isolate" /LENGTH=210 /DNA_ID=CAMNT_0023436783 /DNA_START=15 /DNA_END=647 /DNA_ORIENTATION=+
MAHVAAIHAGLRAAKKNGNYGKDRLKVAEEQKNFWDNIQRQAERNKMVNEILKKYDVTHDKALNKDELACLLQDLNGGEKPTEEEVLWVLKTADRQDHQENGMINRDEIPLALEVWDSYERAKPFIKKMFDKYDTNHSGKLEMGQLKAMLTDLNDGHAPEDEEVKMVMDLADGEVSKKTGGVNKTELQGAITIWYMHVDEEASKSKCCVQ